MRQFLIMILVFLRRKWCQCRTTELFYFLMSVTRAVTAIAMMEATFTQQRMIGLLPTTFVFTLQGSDQAK